MKIGDSVVIKNIIFDLSEVIISGYYGTEKIIASNTDVSEEEFEKRRLEVNDFFLDVMRGNHTEEEYWQGLLAGTNWNISIDELKKFVRLNLNRRVPGTLDLINRIGKNYNLILLSDYVKEWMEYIIQNNDGLSRFNKRFFSYEYGKVKSDSDVFEYLIHQTQIIPEETVFIDDSLVNVQNAQKSGIDAILFTDADSLEEELRKRNINIVEKNL